MKKSYQFFVWIVLVVLGLMAVLVITQLNSSGSIDRLVLGNKQAAATFLVNNRLEEMVNLSFELESKILTARPPDLLNTRPGIKDSLDRLLLKAEMLDTIMREAGISPSLEKVIQLVHQQTMLSSVVLSSGNKNGQMDSLRRKHFGDSIYLNALAFQIEMEKTLRDTLQDNNQEAQKVSFLNKILAITALLAIILLGSIIIRRQVVQLLLIRDLEQARKTALESVKIKDQFLANMSHEIRTPLNALKGFSNLLSKTDLNEEQQKYNSIIKSSGESLLHIVNDILDLSKMESGAWAIKKKPFSLIGLLNDLELTYTTIAKEKNLDFKVLAGDHMQDRLLGDQERLKQVLINLVSNAIKFTNEGNVSLVVKPVGKEEDFATIHFAVFDTGIGIPNDKLNLIFERFEQLDNTFVRRQGGTGLGLAITRMIVESMGGRIMVSSEPGKGSQFSFSVRFAIYKQKDPVEEVPLRPFSKIVNDRSRKKVLLAEDNKVNQLLIQKFLEPYGIQPEVVENGRDVLDLLGKKHFDLVLMDVQMPVLDGISTTRQIRKNLGQNIPVIGLTAYVQPNEIEQCYEAGMNEYLSKPVDEQQFLNMLKKYIYLNTDPSHPGSPRSGSFPPWLAFLKTLCNGNESAMREVLDTMLSELPIDAKLFEDALSQKDTATLRKIAHHLKSTISPLGTDSKISRSLETVHQILQPGDDRPGLEVAGYQFLADLKESLELLKNVNLSFIKT